MDIALDTVFMYILSARIAGEPGYNQTRKATSQNEQKKTEDTREQDCLLSITAIRPCLQIVWQPTRQRMSDGVSGSPEMNFVANGQNRIKSALANV